jgi:hypothetical protein
VSRRVDTPFAVCRDAKKLDVGDSLGRHCRPRRTGVPWFQLTHPSAPDNIVLPNWNAQLNALHSAVTPDSAALVDTTPYGATFGVNDVAQIPREDLSFGVPDWHGTGGSTRSQRNGDNIINWTSPL